MTFKITASYHWWDTYNEMANGKNKSENSDRKNFRLLNLMSGWIVITSVQYDPEIYEKMHTKKMLSNIK